ncbi:MAG: hypothetical protein QOE47_2263 [Pyrinomonadaceae bacterium]|nr:hypothetical protein [Pyrinomonadaceae bacterium]
MMIALVINVFGAGTARAGAQVVGQAPNVERVRENVRKLGIGDATRLQLKLWDGRKVNGYLREARDDDFTIVDLKTGAATTVKYTEVRQVKGSNRSTAAKVGLNLAKGTAIVGAIALGFTLFALIFVPKT